VLPLARVEMADAVHAEPETADYRGILLSLQHELEPDEEPGPSLGLRGAAILAPIVAFLRGRQKEVAVGAVALTLLLLAVVSDSRAGSEADQPAGAEGTARSEFPVAAAASLPEPADRAAADSRDRLDLPASRSIPAPPVATSRTRVVAEPAPASKASKQEETVAVPRKFVPKAVNINLESGVRGIATPVPGLAETFPVQSAPSIAAALRSSFGNAEVPETGIRARLIGPMPTPRYPLHALEVEGDVRVRVQVGPDGRPDMLTFAVVSSPHASLSAAARNVIPGMRFEPARSGGAQSRPISEVVEMGFRFDRGTK